MGPQTIVSLAPFEVKAEMSGRLPTLFFMPASKGEPVLGYVGDGSSVYYMDADRGSLMVLTPSDTFVKEIVESNRDSSILALPGRRPGIFAVEGRFEWPRDSQKVALRYEEAGEPKTKTLKEMVDEAGKEQLEWFKAIVKLADDIWANPATRRHSQISDLQRHAARRLGLVKEWLDKEALDSVIKCKWCTAIVDGAAIVCPTCRNVLNVAAYKALTAEEKADVPKPVPPPNPVQATAGV